MLWVSGVLLWVWVDVCVTLDVLFGYVYFPCVFYVVTSCFTGMCSSLVDFRLRVGVYLLCCGICHCMVSGVVTMWCLCCTYYFVAGLI